MSFVWSLTSRKRSQCLKLQLELGFSGHGQSLVIIGHSFEQSRCRLSKCLIYGVLAERCGACCYCRRATSRPLVNTLLASENLLLVPEPSFACWQ